MRRWGSWRGAWLGVAMVAAVAGCEDRTQARPAGDAPAGARSTKAEVVMAPAGEEDVAGFVRAEREKAKREGRALVVYVGAAWCEPCVRFHKAIEAGELDAAFPSLRLLEFDLERDEARLGRAGYSSKMIPLFVIPDANGQASELRMEGSIKGERAVANITPRLQALLAQASDVR